MITSTGDDNTLILGEGARLGDLGRPKLEFLGSGNRIILADNVVVKRGHYRLSGDNMTISFGQKTTVNGAYILCLEGASVSIGDDCMLSYDIEIRTSDAHSVLNHETGKRVNPAKDVSIGNHVWIGKEVMIMPGCAVANDVIIGARTILTSDVEESHVAVAGVPGRIVSRNRSWQRTLL